MYFKVAKRLNLLAVVLMFFEIIGASAAGLPWTSEPTIYSEELECSIFDSDLFEKTEGEEEGESEEGKWHSRVVLIDFAHIAHSLSAFHSPHFPIAFNYWQFDVRPPVHQLNCVFIV